ncbi:MAG: hypothetical protein RL662_1377 [Bacteroidota bacterium]
MNKQHQIRSVVDSAKIDRAIKDSIMQRDLYTIDQNTSMYFSVDTLKQNQTIHNIELQAGHEGVKRPFTLERDDGVFALLLVCFILFTRIYKGQFSFFKENLSLLFTSHKNLNNFSETTTTEFWFNFILIFQTILLTSIVLFDSLFESGTYAIPTNSFYTISLFTLTLFVFLLIKYFIYRFSGYLFYTHGGMDVWLRNYAIVVEMMGIIAFIPTLMLVYSQYYHEYLLIFFYILFGVSRLILFYRLITFFFKENVNFLFLIAYLCSLEIIPYIILYQVLIHLYQVDIISWLWL